ncbi:hypothetical protein FQZ97_1190690 [compost metagenome]
MLGWPSKRNVSLLRIATSSLQDRPCNFPYGRIDWRDVLSLPLPLKIVYRVAPDSLPSLFVYQRGILAFGLGVQLGMYRV